MSHNVPVHHVQQYKANVMFLMQQGGSKLRGLVESLELTGKRGSLDFIGPTSVFRRTGRHQDTRLVNTEHSRRWYDAATFDWADLIDKEDKLRMLYDPQSPYAQNAARAFNRNTDDVIIAGLFADVITGEEADGTTTWASATTQIITESGSSGMTLTKLNQMREIKEANDDEGDMPWYLAISPKQMTNLLNTTEVKSADYNTVKALVAGTINSFMGFEFVNHNRLLTTSGGKRRCVAWRRDGFGLAVPSDFEVSVDKRPDKNNSTQVFCSMMLGGARTEEKKVIECQCAEA